MIFQQVFGGSVWIDWMLNINIWFLPTLVELKCTFLFSVQVTTIRAVIDSRKSVQLMLSQIVELSFSVVDTGSQFSGHKSEPMYLPWKQIKAIQGKVEVLTSTCTWDPEHWGSNLPSELNKSWVEEKFEFYKKWHYFWFWRKKKTSFKLVLTKYFLLSFSSFFISAVEPKINYFYLPTVWTIS